MGEGVTHHGGVSVYGSGFYLGKKNAEIPLMPDAGNQRMDAGITGFSGYITVSTNISSIAYVIATMGTSISGITPMVDKSGWVIGLTMTPSSLATVVSGQVHWLAIGT